MIHLSGSPVQDLYGFNFGLSPNQTRQLTNSNPENQNTNNNSENQNTNNNSENKNTNNNSENQNTNNNSENQNTTINSMFDKFKNMYGNKEYLSTKTTDDYLHQLVTLMKDLVLFCKIIMFVIILLFLIKILDRRN